MSCIRDPDRLADDRSDRRSTHRDADTRPPTMTENRLHDWLTDRLSRADITYIATVNGINIYRTLRPLYDD